MINFVVKGFQKPLHYKKQKFTKDELQLELYRQTYELMKNYKQVYINSALRKIRLSKLFEYIKTERNKIKKDKCVKPKVKIKTDIDLKREQWVEARNIGNKFSKMNKSKKFECRRQLDLKKETNIISKDRNMRRTKDFGNFCSFLNITKIPVPHSKNTQITHKEQLMKNRRSAFEYGTYYSWRNKLYLKDALNEFDSEYQNLLEKCVAFEKDHLNVCGFLEEKLYACFRSQLGTTYKDSKTQTTLTQEVFLQNPDDEKVSIAKNETKVLRAAVAVQTDEKITENKVGEPIPHILPKRDDLENVCINITKTDTNSNLLSNSNNGKIANPQNDDSASKNPEMSEEFITLSEAAAIGQSFEEAVLDITKYCEPEDTQSNKMKLVLSDLFLTFGLNLVKSTMGKDAIMSDIEMDTVTDKMTNQSDHVLVRVK